jgi:UDP-N-acetylglucosamine--N-acetylmuramyl-(pentapeptide) pyrophosphoryl-undecaprenol N-acetylglucosamine transferase
MITKIVITGSHPTPAQALIERLPKTWQVTKLGDSDSPKLKRYDLLASFPDLFKLPGLVGKFKRELKKIQPAIVVSFGGYPAVPVCWAAKFLNIPVVIHEQTFGAGLSSKLTAPTAAKIAVSWPESRQYFPAAKTHLTGNPIRRELKDLSRQPKNIIYISGGHQGARVINQALKPILPRLLEKYIVYHQYGNQPKPKSHQGYITREYFNLSDLKKIYSQACLVVGRSGINTVTELAYLKIPALLIPLPYTQKNEQLVNAEFLKKLGIAEILKQANLTSESLLAAIVTAAKILPRPTSAVFDRTQVAEAANKLFELIAATVRADK